MEDATFLAAPKLGDGESLQDLAFRPATLTPPLVRSKLKVTMSVRLLLHQFLFDFKAVD